MPIGAAQLKEAGFSEDEIRTHVSGKLREAGFNDAEIDNYFVKHTTQSDVPNDLTPVDKALSAEKPLAPLPQGENLWSGFAKPTLKAVPRVMGSMLGQMAALPGAGIEAGARLLPRISTDPNRMVESGSLQEAQDVLNKRMGFYQNFIKTPEEAKGAENLGLAMLPMQMAGRGLASLGELGTTGDIQKAGQVAKGEPGSNILAPILGTAGEFSGMFLPLGPKALKQLRNRIVSSETWRKATIKERDLIIQDLNDVLNNPQSVKEGLTEADIVRKYGGKYFEQALERRRTGEAKSVFEDIIERPPIETAAKGEMPQEVPEFMARGERPVPATVKPPEPIELRKVPEEPQPRGPIIGPEGEFVEGTGEIQRPYPSQQRLPSPIPLLQAPRPAPQPPSKPISGPVGGTGAFFPEGAPIQMPSQPQLSAPQPLPLSVTPEAGVEQPPERTKLPITQAKQEPRIEEQPTVQGEVPPKEEEVLFPSRPKDALNIVKPGGEFTAGYLDKETGKIYDTGSIHDSSKLPTEIENKVYYKKDAIEVGFIDKAGKFYTRDEALKSPQPEVPAAEAKEPWEMTVEEFRKSGLPGSLLAKSNHRVEVMDALANGKSVPANVLAEYPEIGEQYPDLQKKPEVKAEAVEEKPIAEQPAKEEPPVEVKKPVTPIKRTTPAKGTPERTEIETKYKEIDAEDEQLLTQLMELEKKQQRMKRWGKNWEATKKKIENIKSQRAGLSKEREPYGKKSYLANLEDALENPRDEAQRLAAETQIAERTDKAQYDKIRNVNFEKIKGWLYNEAKRQGYSDELAKDMASETALDISNNPLADTYAPKERFPVIAAQQESYKWKAEAKKTIEEMKSLNQWDQKRFVDDIDRLSIWDKDRADKIISDAKETEAKSIENERIAKEQQAEQEKKDAALRLPERTDLPVSRKELSLTAQKQYIITEVDKAIKEAPEEYEEGKPGYIVIDVPGDGSYRIYNTKSALQTFKKNVSAGLKEEPKKPVFPVKPIVSKGGKAAKLETIGELYKLTGEGAGEWFTDGSVIVKGTPPKGAKYSQETIAVDKALDASIKRPSIPSTLEYFAVDEYEAQAVSKDPLPRAEGEWKPVAVFSSKSGKVAIVDQGYVNLIRNRYPDVTWGMSSDGDMVFAKVDGEPIGAIGTTKTRTPSGEEVDSLPAKEFAKQEGLLTKELEKKQGPLSKVIKGVTEKLGEERGSISFEKKAKTDDLLPVIKSLQPKGQERALVSISELRDKAGLPKDEFDKALLQLAQDGKVALHEHDFPSSLTEEKRNKLLSVKSPMPDWGWKGRQYYGGVVPKEPSPVSEKGILGSQKGSFSWKKKKGVSKDDIERTDTTPADLSAPEKILKWAKDSKVPLNKDDASFLENIMRIPVWMGKAHKEYKPIQDVIDNRFRNYHIIRNAYAKELLDSWEGLSKESLDKVGDIFWKEDALRKRLSDKGKEKLTPEELRAYETKHAVMDFIWKEHLPDIYLQSRLGKRKWADLDEVEQAELKKEIQEIIDAGYWVGMMPHPRPGRYFAKASVPAKTEVRTKKGLPYKSESQAKEALRMRGLDPDNYDMVEVEDGWIARSKTEDTFDTVWREHFDDILLTATSKGEKLGIPGRSYRAPKIKRRLEKDFPEALIEVAENTREFAEQGYFEVSPAVTQELIKAALNRMGPEATPQEIKRFGESLTEAVNDIFKVRGFMEHARKRKNIPGFEKDNWQEALINYITGFAGFASKTIASRQLWDVWPESGIAKKPNLRKYAEKQIKDTFSNMDRADETIGKIRAFMFYDFLGGVVKSALIQPTSNFFNLAPRLTVDTNWATTKITAEMARAAKDVLDTVYSKATGGEVLPGLTRYQTEKAKRLSDGEQMALRELREDGTISTQLTDEVMGKVPREAFLHGVPNKVASGMRFMFGTMELYNREVSAVVAYRVGKEMGKKHTEAVDYARDIINMTQGKYGRTNLPPFARGEWGKWARSAYSFSFFPHNQLALYRDLGTNHGPRGKYGLAKAFMALMFLGGLGAIPFYKELEKAYQKMTGTNIRSEIAKVTGDWAKGIFYGVPGMMGVDITGSIGIGLPGQLEELAGPPLQYGKRLQNFMQDVAIRDWQRAVEDFPLMFQAPRNILSGYRMATEGVEKRSGKEVVDDDFEPVKLTKGEAVGKGLGFQPVKLSETYRKQETRYSLTKFWNDKRDEIVTAAATHKDDPKQTDRIFELIEEFNETKPDYIAPIRVSTIRDRILPIRTRKERILREQVK